MTNESKFHERSITSLDGHSLPPSELFEKLREIDGLSEAKRLPDGWPKAPNALSNKLRRLAPALRQEGIDLKRLPKNTQGMHLWSVRKAEENIAGTAGTCENSRVGPAMNGDEQRCYGGNGSKPWPDKAYGDDGDVFPTQSNDREHPVSDRESGDGGQHIRSAKGWKLRI